MGVLASSAEDWVPLGIPDIPGKEYKDLQVYTVAIGGASIGVYTASLTNEFGDIIKTIGIYPGVESTLGRYTPGAGK